MRSKATGKKQTLTLTLPEQPLPPASADPQSLEIVFGNLITNAIHYTGEEGRVEVSATTGDDQVRVTVKDNGFGIEERHQERIFERFYRVKDDNTRYITGTGLGLPIVKGIVDDLGGTINSGECTRQGEHIYRITSIVVGISASEESGIGGQGSGPTPCHLSLDAQ